MLKNRREGGREGGSVGKRQMIKETDLHESQMYSRAFRRAEGLPEKNNVSQDRAYCNTAKPREEKRRKRRKIRRRADRKRGEKITRYQKLNNDLIFKS